MGSTSLMRVRVMSLETRQFCCIVRMGACVCSVMDGSWSGGLLYVNVGRGGQGCRERWRQSCARLAPGLEAGAERQSEWGVHLIAASLVGWAMYLNCKCGFGSQTAA